MSERVGEWEMLDFTAPSEHDSPSQHCAHVVPEQEGNLLSRIRDLGLLVFFSFNQESSV